MIKKILISLVGFTLTLVCYAADVYYNKNIHADNISEINDRTTALEEKTRTWSAEEWTFTLDNGSQVEKHVGVSSNSWPETCVLYWGESNLTNGAIHLIQTNFPTRNLKLIISAKDMTNVTVRLPIWAPKTEKNISIIIFFDEITGARTFRLEAGSGTAIYSSSSGQAISRIEKLEWDGFEWLHNGMTYTGYSIRLDGERMPKNWIPDDAPSTVEEWIALQNPQTESTPTQPLFGGTFTPPVSPTPDEPSDEDDSQIDDEEPDEEQEEDITEGE